MVKEVSVIKLFNFFKSSQGLSNKVSTTSKIFTFLSIIVGIALVTGFRSSLDYQSVLSPFFQVLIGIPILWMVFYGIYYIFQSAFESKSSIKFWDSYLQIGIPILTGIFVMHFFNVLQYLSQNMYINYLFALLNSIIIIYLLSMFIVNIKNYFSTSYSKVFASLLLVFLVNFTLVALLTLAEFR